MSRTVLQEIELFLAETGMAESSFGRAAVNDWSFIRGLRAGRRLWPETEAKVRAFMAAKGGDRANEDTSVPRHAGVAPRVKAAKACVADGAAEGGAPTPKGEKAAADRWAGRTVTCALCDCRLSDIAVRACQAPDCPQSDREAA